MEHAQIDVYPLIVEGFETLGAKDSSAITRKLLLRDRYYVGQKFLCEGFTALVLVGEQEIAFNDASGGLLRSLPLVQDEPLRRAA